MVELPSYTAYKASDSKHPALNHIFTNKKRPIGCLNCYKILDMFNTLRDLVVGSTKKINCSFHVSSSVSYLCSTEVRLRCKLTFHICFANDSLMNAYAFELI